MAIPNLTELMASLLSERGNNPYANINDPVIRPPVIPNTPWTGPNGYQNPPTPWGTPATLVAPPGGVTPTDPSGSGRGGTAPGSGAYGGMTSSERDTLGKVAGALGIAGMVNPGLSVLGWGIRGALANDKYGITGRRGEIGITEQDVRDAMDYGGMFAGKEAQATRDAQQSAKEAATMAADTFGLGGPTETPTDPFGENRQEAQDMGGPKSSDTPDSPTDTESGANGPGGGFGGGQGPGGSEGADNDSGGHGAAGDGSMNAKGGVRKARTATRATFGEAGPETAFFVPAIMERAGIQGKEAEILRKLKAMVRILEGNKGDTDSESPKAERKEHANGGRRN